MPLRSRPREAGKHFGAAKCHNAKGDVAYYRFEGTHRSTSKTDGSMENDWEGRIHFVGGTGRFEKLSGEGSYRGHRTSANVGYSTWSADVTY